MRRAGNADEFCRHAAQLGFQVEVITGEQEARWIFYGVCGPLPDAIHNRLIIDIGGASTEIALGNDREIQHTESVSLGCVSWRDRFFAPEFNFAANREAAYRAAQLQLGNFA